MANIRDTHPPPDYGRNKKETLPPIPVTKFNKNMGKQTIQ